MLCLEFVVGWCLFDYGDLSPENRVSNRACVRYSSVERSLQ